MLKKTKKTIEQEILDKSKDIQSAKKAQWLIDNAYSYIDVSTKKLYASKVSWPKYLYDTINKEEDYRDNSDDDKNKHELDFHPKVQYPHDLMLSAYTFVLELKNRELWQIIDCTKLLQAMNALDNVFYEYQNTFVYQSSIDRILTEGKLLQNMLNQSAQWIVENQITDRIFNPSEYDMWQDKLEKLFYTITPPNGVEETSYYEDNTEYSGVDA
jgi:hypothetical protein